MSSLDKFPDWSLFSKREEVVLDTELISPAAEVATILRSYQAALREARQGIENERKTWLDALARQAVLVAELANVLDRGKSAVAQVAAQTQESSLLLKRSYQALGIVKDQMLDALRDAGLEIEMPLGKGFDEVAEVVRVDSWQHRKEFASEVVAKVMEPIVRYEGVVVRTGSVVMGAPPEEDTTISQEIEQEGRTL